MKLGQKRIHCTPRCFFVSTVRSPSLPVALCVSASFKHSHFPLARLSGACFWEPVQSSSGQLCMQLSCHTLVLLVLSVCPHAPFHCLQVSGALQQFSSGISAASHVMPRLQSVCRLPTCKCASLYSISALCVSAVRRCRRQPYLPVVSARARVLVVAPALHRN